MPEWMDWKIVGLATLIAGAIWFWLKRRGLEPEGFRRFATNARYRRQLARDLHEHHRRLERAREELLTMTEDDIDELVEDLIRDPEDPITDFQLSELEERAIPALTKGLDHAKVWGRIPKDVMEDWPFEKLCGLIDAWPVPDAIPKLERFLQHPHEGMRETAALTLAAMPLQAPPESVMRILQEPSSSLLDSVLSGLSRQDRDERPISEGYGSQIYPHLFALFENPPPDLDLQELLSLMLSSHRADAVSRFVNPSFFRSDNPALHFVLEGLQNDEIPRRLLTQLKEDLSKPGLEYPQTRQLGWLLRTVAQNADESTFDWILEHVRYPHESIQEDAVEALWLQTGGPLPWEELCERDEDSPASLTIEEQHYMRGYRYFVEVGNGGHAQYFINSSGDQWKLVLAGIQASGARQHETILREALAVFGKDGPSENRGQRGKAMEKLAPDLLDTLSELDNRFYNCTDSLMAKLSLYLLKSSRQI